MGLTRKELLEHKRKLKNIEDAGERKLLRDELRRKREEYWPRKKWPSTSKIAMGYIFLSCTAVQIYSMAAMWHFADLSALYSLIGATVGEVIAFCSYEAKSGKENSKGGIVHDMAMKRQEWAKEPSQQASEDAQG